MKVLFMTGNIHVLEQLVDLDTVNVIEKPFKAPDLLKRIRDLLDG